MRSLLEYQFLEWLGPSSVLPTLLSEVLKSIFEVAASSVNVLMMLLSQALSSAMYSSLICFFACFGFVGLFVFEIEFLCVTALAVLELVD